MKKFFTLLILTSALAVPVLGFAQMGIERPEGYIFKHDLGDYSTCCLIDNEGTEYCIEEGDDINTWNEHGGKDYTACVLIDKILTVGDWLFVIILVAAVIIILIAAFQFLTAAGSPDKVASARNSLIYALIGVAVAFLAKVLVKVIASIISR